MFRLAMMVFYVLAICSPFVTAIQPLQPVLLPLCFIVLVIHLIEYLLLRKRFAKIETEDSHFLQTLLFGFIYWRPLFREIESREKDIAGQMAKRENADQS